MELNQNKIYDKITTDWWENIFVYWEGSYTLVYYDRDILFKRLKKKFGQVLKIKDKTIIEELRLREDLHLKGVDIVFLVGVLECEYDLKPDNKLACQINTVGELLNYCEQMWPAYDVESWFSDPVRSKTKSMTTLKQILKTIK